MGSPGASENQQKIEKTVFGTSLERAGDFRSTLGAILNDFGRFWKDFAWILGRFSKDFRRFLKGFTKPVEEVALRIRATRGDQADLIL